MVLSFMRHFRNDKVNKTPTDFKDKIQHWNKIHTIRQGNRWQPGHTIHFWEGTPRNPAGDPAEFSIKPESVAGAHIPMWATDETITQFWPRVCITEEIEIDFSLQVHPHDRPEIRIGGETIDEDTFNILCENDGLTPEQFIDWFRRAAKKNSKRPGTDGGQIFKGQIIHWTNKPYNAKKAKIHPQIEEAKNIPF